MKNKEIEKILNERKIDTYAIISKEEAKTILSYIEQLEKELQNYKDLDISNMETIDCQELEIVNRENEITKLENNRDKAYEFIKEKRKVFEWYDTDLFYLESLLKGDSDDK